MLTSIRISFALTAVLLIGVLDGATAQTVPPASPDRQQIQEQLAGPALQGMLRARLQASGLTPDQVRRRLASAGYNPRALDAYLSESDTLPPDPTQATLDALRVLGMEDLVGVAAQDSIDLRPEPTPLTDEERRLALRVFGVEVFSRGTSNFEPVSHAAVPSSYVLGPGDELVLVITGSVELVHTLPVTREGFILIPQVGQVWVNGLTLDGLRDQLYTRLGRVYSGVRRDEGASTYFDVSLARLRSNQIYIAGEVARPGAYAVSPLASVLNALYQAGGPTGNGSFRDVHVMRGGRIVQRADLYAYLLGGDNLGDIRLEPGDVIFVPPRGIRVSIRGEVTREAIYELKPDETIADLVRFAGGVNAPAHVRQARLTRVLPPARRDVPGVDRVVMDIDLADAMRVPARAPRLEPGDEILVLPVREDVRNMVSLNGSVWRPGSYEYRRGMRAWDLIETGQGLTPEAFVARAHLSRFNPGDSTLVLIPFSLERDGTGRPVDNPLLEEFDVLTIYSRAGQVEDLPIDVAGEVREPRSERYQEGMTLRDAILRAGGLRRSADPVVEVARLADPAGRGRGEIARVYRIHLDSTYFLSEQAARHYLGAPEGMRYAYGEGSGQAAEFLLQPHDRIFVRRLADLELPRTVRVQGEVAYPGPYTLTRKDERLRDVITRAGGLTATAYAAGFRLERDGQVVDVDLPGVLARPGHSDNLILMPGDQLTVPEYNPVILVRGAVNSPSAVLYKRGAGLTYYINSAGGYARDADRSGVHVRFANGTGAVRERRMLLFRSEPVPGPGATVTVPHLLPEDRLDVRGMITDIVQISASIATVALVLSRIR
jgi:polysaccharide biosynthesis/export protein